VARCAIPRTGVFYGTAPLAFENTTVAPLGLPADVGFVGFDCPGKKTVVLVKKGAYFVEHAPCGLIRNTKLSLKLLGRDAAAGASHEIHRVEPEPQRRCGVLKDSTYQRVFVVPAPLASKRGASLLAVVLRDLLARRAVDACRVELFDKEFKASSIVWKLPFKLHKGISGLRSGGTFWVISVYLRHTKNILDGSTAVKGIIAITIDYKS
jgi:hypothetical protein